MKKIFVLILSFFLFPAALLADETVSVTVRISYEGTLVYSTPISLPVGGQVSISDSAGGNHSIQSQSALAALAEADTTSAAFSISELTYYPEWNALYVNCLDIASPERHACDMWMYEVNRISPSVGMDTQVLSNGDVLDMFYGSVAENAPEAPAEGNGNIWVPRRVEITEIMPVAEPVPETAPVTATETTTPDVLIQLDMPLDSFAKNLAAVGAIEPDGRLFKKLMAKISEFFNRN